MTAPCENGQLQRLDELDRPRVSITVDGVESEALYGDTLLAAILVRNRRVRESEFGDGPRAGFCWIGACQDCWVWLSDNRRVRACTTPVSDGMTILTRPTDTRYG